mmetsp:Transcript_9874/g.31330  ORF Transcript_9874/g.31330 Transcript_9874/m.31330 type:complete len:229 (-) Transcript_9874:197-883(-)
MALDPSCAELPLPKPVTAAIDGEETQGHVVVPTAVVTEPPVAGALAATAGVGWWPGMVAAVAFTHASTALSAAAAVDKRGAGRAEKWPGIELWPNEDSPQLHVLTVVEEPIETEAPADTALGEAGEMETLADAASSGRLEAGTMAEVFGGSLLLRAVAGLSRVAGRCIGEAGRSGSRRPPHASSSRLPPNNSPGADSRRPLAAKPPPPLARAVPAARGAACATGTTAE